ncbi:nucleotidyl transferase AbiEii/AbiGii toxin family protein [Prauserella alba]|uniref:Nucleotidyl transferase AbiEii toxin, Type IV TA system n=1 Tax=Prauserella alba TaxID=176898 RepID=A0ABP4FNS5_9PSEU|nr:nucleotidyl transferase AbiEii/AbiGii toxin family protein [Prauserella alba]MCP2178839.1 Nucleotidyl transferase AbiEii toxin, Type IV TA system [Prauserella alba]
MRYPTGPAFRRALEDRLKARADGDGARIARDRKRVVFDRFLARLVEVAAGEWVLKGGFALDLRLEDQARSTKDIDLGCWLDGEALLDVLIDAAGEDRGDFFTFAVERAGDPPDRFGGAHRFRVTASLAGRLFERFVVDVGRPDDVRHLETEIRATSHVLGFADVAPVAVPVIPIVVQVVEKLHAYTRVYEGGRGSSRAKDVVDLALIAQTFTLDAQELLRAMETIFSARGTHEPPRALSPPPEQWRAPYRQLAQTVGLDDDLDAGHRTVTAMLDPILNRDISTGTWSPGTQQWDVQ